MTTVPAVRLIREERQGARFAAARGIADATGEFVAKIDADTQVDPGWSAAIHDFFSVVDDDVAGGSGMCTMHDLPFQSVFRRMQTRMTAQIAERLDRGELSPVADTFGANCLHGRGRTSHPISVSGPTSRTTSTSASSPSTADWRLAWIPALEARISGRRLCTSPVSYWRYTARTHPALTARTPGQEAGTLSGRSGTSVRCRHAAALGP